MTTKHSENGELGKTPPKSQLEREREAISAHRATIQEAVDLLMDANEGAAINSHANRVELANKLKAIIGPNKG